ncbi:MAG: hypothetical protein H3C34_25240, partial [Caldilineaceae bacterium]|nr:hypothetical protein [Caldilineaceae bacterium]
MPNTSLNSEKLRILEELRIQAKLTPAGASRYFGLRDRESVRNWELGHKAPPPKHREHMKSYLHSKLGLSHDHVLFLQIWKDIMVGEWGWPSLTVDEMSILFRNVWSSVLKDVPQMAPNRPPHRLIGRSGLIRQLKQRLFNGGHSAFTALNGLPGVGKTAIAVELAHDLEVLSHFPHGVLWAGVGRDATEAGVLRHLHTWAQDVGMSPETIRRLRYVDDLKREVHKLIGNRSFLIVIDDVWNIDGISPLMIAGPNCAYLMTTRLPRIAEQFAGQGAISIPKLEPAYGRTLLSELAPLAVEEEPEAASDLVEVVGGLPLALILLGNHLRQVSAQQRRLRTMIKRLKQAEHRLRLALPSELLGSYPSLSDSAISLWASIEISDQALMDESRDALRSLSVFLSNPNSFTEQAALAVTAKPAQALDQLVDSGLLEIAARNRYSVHQVIHDYAKANLVDTMAYSRMVDFFTGFIDTHADDHTALAQEHENLLGSLDTAFRLG